MAYYKPKMQRGCTVIVQNDQVDKALRKFKKKIAESGLLEELKERAHYEKPTTERKRKKGAAQARWRKKLRDQQLPKKLY
jgi:small subunit ribosomal protein S21